MRRRRWPVVVMVLGVLGLLTWYVVYTQQVVRELRVAAAGQGQMYSRIFRALQDTSATHDPTVTLLELSQQIRESGLPLVRTDPDGRVSAVANLPFDEPLDGDRTRAFLRDLDRHRRSGWPRALYQRGRVFGPRV